MAVPIGLTDCRTCGCRMFCEAGTIPPEQCDDCKEYFREKSERDAQKRSIPDVAQQTDKD